jgi:uncharacterized membrane-anchored protein
LFLVACLFLALLLWQSKYKTLEVYPITEKGKELCFWVAVLFSNSLGTAFGDFLSDNLELGYLHGAIVTGIIIFIVIVLHYLTKINRILLFWIAFIFTRPFGATFGDFLTKPVSMGGMNFDRLTSSLVCLGIMAALLLLEYRCKRE